VVLVLFLWPPVNVEKNKVIDLDSSSEVSQNVCTSTLLLPKVFIPLFIQRILHRPDRDAGAGCSVIPTPQGVLGPTPFYIK